MLFMGGSCTLKHLNLKPCQAALTADMVMMLLLCDLLPPVPWCSWHMVKDCTDVRAIHQPCAVWFGLLGNTNVLCYPKPKEIQLFY